MNLYEKIRLIAADYDESIKTYMLEDARMEVSSINFETYPVIVISPDISGSGTFEANGDINDSSNYVIKFLTDDIRDNPEAENYTGIDSNSYQKALDMLKLGVSVLNKFKHENLFKTKPTFTYNLVFKTTANNLTGAIFNLSFSVAADKICL